VVRVDVQVALGAHGQIEQRVAADLVKHVVEKRNAARKLGAPGAVDCEAH